MNPKWLSIVGIGEDGLAGLSPAARSLLDRAEVIVGGDRHLAMLPPTDRRERLVWQTPIETTIQALGQQRGRAVCVLASGDPLWYGIGATLAKRWPIEELTIIPAPSAFSLACARLAWPLADVDLLSLCGRDRALLNGYLYPEARLLVLSADRQTPAIVAQHLSDRGWGASEITVLERLGGPQERLVRGRADAWPTIDLADLNLMAIRVRPIDRVNPDDPNDPGDLAKFSDLAQVSQRAACRLAGLPDAAYSHDGQLTKREVRAVTLAMLAPLPGQRLWDVGAGCGSIGIEWLRSDRRCQAIAIEQNPQRLGYLADNAIALGVPHLQIITGQAPAALADLPDPDAIFIGGGVTTPDLLAICWQRLRSGGRLVANAVTVESEACLYQWHQDVGGDLNRIAIQRAEPIGRFLGWKAFAPVTQWVVRKP